MNSPQAFGRKVARAQDRLSDKARITETAESLLFDGTNLLFQTGAKSKTAKWKVFAFATAAALVLMTTGFIVTRISPAPDLSVTVNGRPTDPNERRRVYDPKAEETTIAFSDGSRIRLEGDTRTRFIEITPKGAGLLVEQGRLVAEIAHLEGADWRLFAGPFEVRVTGTQFTLSWDQQHEFFSVTMESGSVEISGPSPTETRLVRAGETFKADVKEHQIEIIADRKVKDDGSAKSPLPVGPSDSIIDETPEVQMGSADKSAAQDEPSRSLSLPSKTEPTDRFRDMCSGLSSTNCLEQADATRLSGDVTQAAEQYAKIRKCFPQSSAAVLCAFNLGKIAFDIRGDWDGAAVWFGRYLREQRGEGPVREAEGRLMEAYANGHRLKEAQAVARRYLAEYPKGPHAAYATSLIEEDADSTAAP
jgi:TolA-binding protein